MASTDTETCEALHTICTRKINALVNDECRHSKHSVRAAEKMQEDADQALKFYDLKTLQKIVTKL